ncbi:uncharacterized mitochondrial protein AtMg00860-like [Phragmites australis]|uniref:uncharacterized mitochondrial protein AtMg00860-like n=1 Tax=Phragmites australis TaxID=29695 RepID=UPI002D77AD9A|nr:uncharacterized mitochondrial protein AtMg00860-like [Phragmites australis]
MGSTLLTALLDSGLTHNFIDDTAARKAGIPIQPCTGLSIAVANGDRVMSPGKCLHMKTYIDSDVFAINFHALPLGGYSMDHQLFLKRSKCAFGTSTVAYLDHVILADGVAMDQQKVQAVLDWPRRSSVRAVRGFLVLTGYYRHFIKNYGTLVVPLTKLLHKEGFAWTQEATKAFHAL